MASVVEETWAFTMTIAMGGGSTEGTQPQTQQQQAGEKVRGDKVDDVKVMQIFIMLWFKLA